MQVKLKDRTADNERRIIKAIASLIADVGYYSLSERFKRSPNSRQKIAYIVANDLSSRLGPVAAQRFLAYANLVSPEGGLRYAGRVVREDA